MSPAIPYLLFLIVFVSIIIWIAVNDKGPNTKT